MSHENKISKASKKQPSLKEKVNESFKKVTLNVLVELGKIKKPNRVTFMVAKLLCLVVEAFRDDKYNLDSFDDWSYIQHYILSNPNRFH